MAFRARIGGSIRLPAPWRDASGNRVIALNGTPDALAVGAGSVWVLQSDYWALKLGDDIEEVDVASARRMMVSEVDAVTGRTGAHATIYTREPGFPPAFAAGEGAAWLGLPTVRTAKGRVVRMKLALVRVDARTHRLTIGPEDPRLNFAHGISAIATGEGAVWLHSDHKGILRADPRSARILQTVCRAARGVRTLASGTYAVWAVAHTTTNCAASSPTTSQPAPAYSLLRIDLHSNRVTRTVPLRHEYGKLVVAAHGAWAIRCSQPTINPPCQPRREARCRGCEEANEQIRRENRALPALQRISLRDGRSLAVIALPPGRIAGLAASRDAVWISQTAFNQSGGTLRRLDITTGRLSTALKLRGAPSNVSIGEGHAWVIDTFARTLIGVPLDRSRR